MSLPEDTLTPELEALKAKHAGKPPLGSPAAEGPSPDAVLEATRRKYEGRVEEEDEKPESDEELGYELAAYRRIYSDKKAGLPTLEEREKIQQDAEALARQEARERLDPTMPQKEPSTAEILGIEIRPLEAYQPPPPPEGQTWRPEVTRSISMLASEWAMSDGDHARLYAEITRGYAAPEISEEERLERTAALIREYRQRWGGAFDRKVAVMNKVIAEFDGDLLRRVGLDLNPWFIDMAGRLVDQAERYNTMQRRRREEGR